MTIRTQVASRRGEVLLWLCSTIRFTAAHQIEFATAGWSRRCKPRPLSGAAPTACLHSSSSQFAGTTSEARFFDVGSWASALTAKPYSVVGHAFSQVLLCRVPWSRAHLRLLYDMQLKSSAGVTRTTSSKICARTFAGYLRRHLVVHQDKVEISPRIAKYIKNIACLLMGFPHSTLIKLMMGR